jgi:hypothetical protein
LDGWWWLGGWLAGWLVGWSVGWLAGWLLAGWLVVKLVSIFVYKHLARGFYGLET